MAVRISFLRLKCKWEREQTEKKFNGNINNNNNNNNEINQQQKTTTSIETEASPANTAIKIMKNCQVGAS